MGLTVVIEEGWGIQFRIYGQQQMNSHTKFLWWIVTMWSLWLEIKQKYFAIAREIISIVRMVIVGQSETIVKDFLPKEEDPNKGSE